MLVFKNDAIHKVIGLKVLMNFLTAAMTVVPTARKITALGQCTCSGIVFPIETTYTGICMVYAPYNIKIIIHGFKYVLL